MHDGPSLHELIAETVSAYCAQNGGGIPIGYVFAVQRIDGGGVERIHIGCMDGQSPILSAGLSTYLDTTVRLDIEDDLFACECEDDDEER